MSTLAVIASIALGVAFLVAGGTKVAAGDAWVTQAQGLGAPRWTVPILPWIEIVLGALLVTQVARVVAGVAAAVLLVAFTILIGIRLAQGRHPPCACFGAWSTAPLGAGHVVRNVVLFVLAVVVVLG